MYSRRGIVFTLALGAAAAFIYAIYSLAALLRGPVADQHANFFGMMAGGLFFLLLATFALLIWRDK